MGPLIAHLLLVLEAGQSGVPPKSLVDSHSRPPSDSVPACFAALLWEQVVAGGNLPLSLPAFHGPQLLHLGGLLTTVAAAAVPTHTYCGRKEKAESCDLK